DAAACRHVDVGCLAVASLDGQFAFTRRQDLDVDSALGCLGQQPRLRPCDAHASPPTTMSLTSRCGCPTSVGIDPDIEPHMPGSVSRSSDTATIFLMVSGPLPSSMAPRTGSAIWPSRIRYPSLTAKLYSPEPGRTWPPPMTLA